MRTTQGYELILPRRISSYPASKNKTSHNFYNFCVRTTQGYELILPPGISSYPASKNKPLTIFIIFVCAQPMGTS